MPHRSSVPMSWRLAKHRYAMVGTRCADCGSLHFPPRLVCQKCSSDKNEGFVFSGKGKILSYTVIRTPPEGFMSPYVVGLVQLDEGPVISGHIVNKEGVKIGAKVRQVFRKLYEDGKSGVINYGFKFELAE